MDKSKTILACDIGATKTEIAVYISDINIHSKIYSDKFLNDKYGSPEEILIPFIYNFNKQIDCACICVPGPVDNGKCYGTNISWEFDEKVLSENLKIKNLRLLNDIEAVAAAVPHYKPDELITVCAGKAGSENKNKAVISPGTGLGQAALIYHDGKYITVSTEGGHTDFSPENETEAELMFYIKKKDDHVSFEKISSGKGIINIFNFLKTEKKIEIDESLDKKLSAESDIASVIFEEMQKGNCGICRKTFEVFVSVLARQAGNMVLNFKATGGVYLAGSVSIKLAELINSEIFMNSFLNKGSLSYLTEAAPVYIIKDKSPVITGAAITAFGM